MAQTSSKKLSENMEEYLESIYRLSTNGGRVKTTEISKTLNIAPGSVTQMLQKLSDMDLVEYSQYKGVKLTEDGLLKAKKITRKHRLLERFLHDILKLKDNLLHEQACEMEHSLSDDAERALCQVLEHPDTCPDDALIPACDLPFESCEECMARRSEEVGEVGTRNENLVPIMDLKNHQEGKVSFIRGDNKIIRRLLDMGITIGAKISVIKVAPMKGPVEVSIRGSKLAIGHEIACNVFVELEVEVITREVIKWKTNRKKIGTIIKNNTGMVNTKASTTTGIITKKNTGMVTRNGTRTIITSI